MTKPGKDGASKDRQTCEPGQQATERHVCELLDEIHDLEQFRRQQLLLRKLSGYLKSSLSTAEALSAIEQYGPQLWPAASGAVYFLHDTGDFLERAASWGDAALTSKSFDWQDCWALRNLRPHCVLESATEIPCRHTQQQAASLRSICVPLTAHGQMLGLLSLQQFSRSGDLSRNQTSTDTALSLATAVAEDLSLTHANVRLRESLHEQSIKDALTGLFNRRFVDEFLVRELARAERKTRQLSMIALDIDHFKRINDTFGHGAGDKVLQKIGTILQAHVRGSDVASRIGGEEFLLLLAESPLTLAVKRAEDIRSAIHKMALQYENKDLGLITASFGAVAFPDHGRTAESLIRAADRALYAAKNGGRNQVVSANPPIH
jgi:diguanylate cyclase (GGDEF)-like protein